jgi:hypothetical protein
VQVIPDERLGQLNVNWSTKLLSDVRLTLKLEELPTAILADAGVTEMDASSSCNCANAPCVFPERVPLIFTLYEPAAAVPRLTEKFVCPGEIDVPFKEQVGPGGMTVQLTGRLRPLPCV